MILSSVQNRLVVLLLLSFLSIGIFTSILIVYSSKTHQQEVSQVMHRDLAKHVIKDYLLFDEQGQPDLKEIKKTFHDLMILGPNFEFYLIDPHGNIITFSADPHKIQRKKINITPIKHFIRKKDIKKPIYGDDPRSTQHKKIFTAAPIVQNEITQGYLYVIIGSQIQDKISELIDNHSIVSWALWIFLSGLIFSLIALLWLTGLITKPLKKLTYQIDNVKASGFSKKPLKDEKFVKQLNEWKENNPNEIHRLGCAFRHALEKLGDQYKKIINIEQLRKELLSHISHDLRTPLSSLLGYLETWELNHKTLSEKESIQYIKTAKKNAKRVSSLVDQLFELAHLDSDNVQIHREQIPIAELVQDVLQKFQIQAKEKNITLDVHPKDTSILVYADIEKLDRIFTNLIENAVRHTNSGGSIKIYLKKTGQIISVVITDTGIGIPENDLPHILKPHYKAGNSVRENTAHSGLGLAITDRLLKLHQSHLSVSSRVHKGTSFKFTLPSSPEFTI